MSNAKNIRENFGATVKELRTRKSLTQEQLSEYLGLQRHTISKIETGRAFVSSEVLSKLSDFFNVSPSFFFNEKIKRFSEKDINYINEIKKLLSTFNTDKLHEIYNILSAMNK